MRPWPSSCPFLGPSRAGLGWLWATGALPHKPLSFLEAPSLEPLSNFGVRAEFFGGIFSSESPPALCENTALLRTTRGAVCFWHHGLWRFLFLVVHADRFCHVIRDWGWYLRATDYYRATFCSSPHYVALIRLSGHSDSLVWASMMLCCLRFFTARVNSAPDRTTAGVLSVILIAFTVVFARGGGRHFIHFFSRAPREGGGPATRPPPPIVQCSSPNLISPGAPSLFPLPPSHLIPPDLASASPSNASLALPDSTSDAYGDQLRFKTRCGRRLASRRPAVRCPYLPLLPTFVGLVRRQLIGDRRFVDIGA